MMDIPQRVSGWSHYIGEGLGQTEPGGPQDTTTRPLEARLGGLWPHQATSSSLPKLPMFLVCEECNPKNFVPFGLRLIWISVKQKQGRKQELARETRLIGLSQKMR
jgi:hypothetical protein